MAMKNITIRSSTMVPPISETPKMVVWLANVDLLVRATYGACVYFYRPTGAPDFFDGDIVRAAIGKALVPFFPNGGRLMRQEDGRIAIKCEGQGVLFVEADSDACIDDFGDFAGQPSMQEIVPKVTRFKCGGVAFGVKTHHYVTDGVSGTQFNNTISEFARGASVTVTPWVDRSLLRARNPPTPKFPHVEYLPAPALLLKNGLAPGQGNNGHVDYVYGNLKAQSNGQENEHGANANDNGISNDGARVLQSNEAELPPSKTNPDGTGFSPSVVIKRSNGTNFTAPEINSTGMRDGTVHAASDEGPVPPVEVAVVGLSKEELAILKNRVLNKENGIPYSTYETLSGHIWKCMTKARGLDGPQPTKLYIATDGRARLVPPLPKDYFGNVLFTATPMSTAGEIVHRPTSYAAGQIHNAVARMDDEYLRSAIDYLEMHPDVAKVARGASLCGAPNLSITSWARLPLYDCDFGWGRPIFVGPACIPYDGVVYVLPGPVNFGSLTLSLGLRADYMQKFRELILNVEDADQ
ncbi:unnamed protein product [Calypogeia fissa]